MLLIMSLMSILKSFIIGKLILSLLSGAACLVSLGKCSYLLNYQNINSINEGFTSQYGGLSTSSKLTANGYDKSTSAHKAADALAAGYGFGTAVFFFAFILVSSLSSYLDYLQYYHYSDHHYHNLRRRYYPITNTVTLIFITLVICGYYLYISYMLWFC